MNIVLIRHLSTVGNEQKRYIGRTDEALSETAVEGFKQEMKKISDDGSIYPQADLLITSPMKRCIQTAHLIYPGVKIVAEDMLRECDFGEFEGLTYEDLKDRYEYQKWIESGGMTAFPGGESQKEFRKRCVSGIKKWIRYFLENDIDRAAFIVHGGTIMSALSALDEKGRGFYEWQVKNGCGFKGYVSKREWMGGKEILRNLRPAGKEIK